MKDTTVMKENTAMNVAAIVNQDVATVEDAKVWVKAMKEKGRWSASAARMRVTALDALVGVLGPEESRVAKDVLAVADTLQKRWAVSKNADGDTAAVYGGSVRSTLKLYLAYLENPATAWANFEAKPKKARKRAEVEAVNEPMPAAERQAMLPLEAQTKPVAGDKTRNFPLGDGRVVEFRLPGTFTVRDLAKLTCHMATFCADFDPARPTEGTVLAMMKPAERV